LQLCLKVSTPKIFISRSTDLNIKVIPCSVDRKAFNQAKTMTNEFLLQRVTASESPRTFGKHTLRFKLLKIISQMGRSPL
jgi:hypothetical protein